MLINMKTPILLYVIIYNLLFVNSSETLEKQKKFDKISHHDKIINAESSPQGRWYREVAIAADNEVCAAIGKRILEKHGGSVVDAGLAVLFCNGVVDQAHMGLGGGVVILVHASPRAGGPKETVYISADDTAPGWVTPEEIDRIENYEWPYNITRDENGNILAWNSFRNVAIGVPGELAGYYKAWQKYGKLPWGEHVKPSIHLARNGFKITKAMKDVLAESKPLVKASPSLSNMFMKSKNIFHTEGDILTDSALVDTLEEIQKYPKSFYTGKLAEKIVEDVKEFGGRLTLEDFRQYKARVVIPERFPIGGGKYTAHVPRQPFAGPMMAFVLNIMESYNMTNEDVSTHEGIALFYHRYIEAWKFAYGHNDCFGDDFEHFEICKEITYKLKQKSYARLIKQKIDDHAVQNDVNDYILFNGDSITSHGTSHLSIAARDGSTFLATSSINSVFGSGNKGRRTGIVFNDRLTDFTPKANVVMKNDVNANLIAPGKQARSFRAPFFVTDQSGDAVLAIGGSGGSRIMSAVLQDVIFHLHFGFNLQDAIEAPRMVPMPYYPEFPVLHDDFHPKTLDFLNQRGQNITPVHPSYAYTAVVQGVSLLKCRRCQNGEMRSRCNDLCIEVISDYRKGGKTDGI